MARFTPLVLVAALILMHPIVAWAAPLVVPVGGAQATLEFLPDPPHVGKAHVTVTLSGTSAEALAHTTATFATMMPSMSMGGPSGVATMTAPGRFEFSPMLGMAAGWDIQLKFAGGVNGIALYHVAVGNGSTSSANNAAQPADMATTAPSSSGSSSMSSMAGMSSTGDPSAWRTATFALVAILVIGMFAVLIVRRDRRPLTLGITFGAALITLGLAIAQARYAAPAMDMSAMSSVQGEAPIPVTLASVSAGGGRADVFTPGTVAPYLTQDVVTRAAGILGQFTAYAGDHVRAGQIIATLDAPDLQSQAAAANADAIAQNASAQAAEIEAHHHAPNGVVIASAETSAMQSDLAAARSDRTAKLEQRRYWQNEIAREKSLLDQGAVSQQEYQDERSQAAAADAAADAAGQRVTSLEQQVLIVHTKQMDAGASVEQMQAEAVSARAQAMRAQANARTQSTLAGYTSVTSPSDATVVKRLIDPGTYVASGTPIARIAVLDRLRLQANVAQQDLVGITQGTPIDARLSDGSVVHGRVSSVSPVADPTTHTAAVEAIVTNVHVGLVPGGYARVTFHPRMATATSAGMQVPSSAIVGSGTDTAVWTSVHDTAHRVGVRVLSDDGVNATVRGDLQRGMHVVVDGAPTLEEGQAISDQRS